MIQSAEIRKETVQAKAENYAENFRKTTTRLKNGMLGYTQHSEKRGEY